MPPVIGPLQDPGLIIEPQPPAPVVPAPPPAVMPSTPAVTPSTPAVTPSTPAVTPSTPAGVTNAPSYSAAAGGALTTLTAPHDHHRVAPAALKRIPDEVLARDPKAHEALQKYLYTQAFVDDHSPLPADVRADWAERFNKTWNNFKEYDTPAMGAVLDAERVLQNAKDRKMPDADITKFEAAVTAARTSFASAEFTALEARVTDARAKNLPEPYIKSLEEQLTRARAAEAAKTGSLYTQRRDGYDAANKQWSATRQAARDLDSGNPKALETLGSALGVKETPPSVQKVINESDKSASGAKSWVDKMNDGLTKTYATADNLVKKPMETLAGFGTAFQGLQRLFDPLGETPGERVKRQGAEVKAIADAVAGERPKYERNVARGAESYKRIERTKPSDSAEGLLKRPDNTVAQISKQHPNYDKNPQQAAGQPAPLNSRGRRDKADEERERRYARQNMV